MTTADSREKMVEWQLAARGIHDPAVLRAFREVPREAFLPPGLAEFAYRDAPLPIGQQQTISQPYVVALTVQALELQRHDRVLEIGTGSGYAAAILGRIASEVFTVERLKPMADEARERLARLDYPNVHVLHGDGTLGWPAHAPYEAIAVAAGGPRVPRALCEQLAIGGRLVIPVGPDEGTQMLTRITRVGLDDFREELLTEVRFVPLIGAEGWGDGTPDLRAQPRIRDGRPTAKLVREVAEPLQDYGGPALDALIDRMGDARVILLGEATHGTSEFYRMRAELTKALVRRGQIDFVAVEADWPDAARIDEYVVGSRPRSTVAFSPFARFPTWMWRNEETQAFVDWLRAFNADQPRASRRVGFHGLDLYSLFTSISAVLGYLDQVDPDAARVARERYGALTPWQQDPQAYGRAVLSGGYASCETAVVAMLRDMLARRMDYARQDGARFFDAAQNARVVAGAEGYYRALFYGSAASWNLRDRHMFDTLQALLALHGPSSRAIVWAHNTHVGDAAATEMRARGELNLGQLCRAHHDDRAYAVGFATDRGTVAAAAGWDQPMERMSVRPSRAGSYERVFHDTGIPAFTLHLRHPRREEVRSALMDPRLQRAIGVVYRPEGERLNHYFHASLPRQFDELIWFDETEAVRPLGLRRAAAESSERHPFDV